MRRSPLYAALVALSLAAVVWIALHYRAPATGPATGGAELGHLPYYAFRSLLRMVAAYALSFAFALGYGYAAATSKRAEKVLLPILDILQSVPVLGFFPVAIAFFVATLPGVGGVEAASIFLIFTGMAWNMAFGVYEGLTTIPADMLEASKSFGVRGLLQARKLLFPAVVPRLVYNSIVSWAGGWYFLIACEIVTVGGAKSTLPGIGSFLQRTSDDGRVGDNLVGIAVLVGLVVAFDLLLWRPLSAYAERFRYEFSATRATEGNAVLEWWLRSRTGAALRKALSAAGRGAMRPVFSALARAERARPATQRLARRAAALASAAAAVWVCFALCRALYHLVRAPWPAGSHRIPLAVLASAGRLTAAYAITLAWTIPVAIWAGTRPRIARFVTPIAEIGASVPAIALFPLMVVVLIQHIGVNGASVLLVLTGMQWYVLFNLLAGVAAIPEDLREASRSLGLPFGQRMKRLVLPAIVPSLITGSITGWGGGWNALIVSEQLSFGGHKYSAFGIGALLDDATYEGGGDPVLLALCLVAMILAIVVLNRLVWRRLYAYASERFRLDT